MIWLYEAYIIFIIIIIVVIIITIIITGGIAYSVSSLGYGLDNAGRIMQGKDSFSSPKCQDPI
jgi:hypothetical protein